jgi:3-dehydroquinate dehydratase II
MIEEDTMRIFVINGPNLDILGKREPEIYGTTTLWDIETMLKEKFPDVKFEFYQSNNEGDIINTLHKALDNFVGGVVLNAAAFTHYSYAIRDAVAALKVPVIEVHLSNVHAREEFRRLSVIAPACKGIIAGFGIQSYVLAVSALIEKK